MFSNLRVGTPLYVLHKNDLRVEEGEIQLVGTPIPQFGTTFVAGTMQPQKMVVDLKVKIGDQIVDLQKMPADQTIADFGINGMVVSESRESILNEVVTIKKQSQSVLESREYHEERIAKCDELIQTLNPTAKHEAEQRQEIDSLKRQIADMGDDMTDIKGMLTKLLKSKKEE